MLVHLRLQRADPGRVRPAQIGQQPVACPHRRFIAGAVRGMTRMKRQGETIEEAPATAGAVEEQPVHRRRQPDDREMIGQSIGGRGDPADPHLPPVGRIRADAGAQHHAIHLRRDAEAAAAILPRHRPQCRAAQPPAGRQHRYRFQYVGLACAIVAGQQDEWLVGHDQRVRMVAEITQGEAADHRAAVARTARRGKRFRPPGCSACARSPCRHC